MSQPQGAVQAAVEEILSSGNDDSFIFDRIDLYLTTFGGSHSHSYKLDAETIKAIETRLAVLSGSGVLSKDKEKLEKVALFYGKISRAALLQANEEGESQFCDSSCITIILSPAASLQFLRMIMHSY